MTNVPVILKTAKENNISLAISSDGELTATGPEEAIDMLLPWLREYKKEIVDFLHGGRTADRLSPEERVKWCLAHELTQGGRCQNNKRLDGCPLWQSINHRRILPRLG